MEFLFLIRMTVSWPPPTSLTKPHLLIYKIKHHSSSLLRPSKITTIWELLAVYTMLPHWNIIAKKFDSRARKYILLGYPFGVKGYKLLDLENHLFSFQEMWFSMNRFFHINQILPFLTPQLPRHFLHNNSLFIVIA